jgi:tape measure domain-containing protein
MAEYRVEFTADSGSAERSIKNLKKAIKGVTKEFEGAEIGAEEFLQSASDLSGLQKELKDARSAVVDVDKAYRDLNKAIDAIGDAYDQAGRDAQNYHNKLLGLARDSFEEEDRLRNKNFQAEVDDFDRRLKLAATSAKKMSAQQRAIMEFRAGMGAKGAIPEIASPIRGGIEYEGSPDYLEEIAKAAKKAQQELDDAAKAAGTIAPPVQAFRPGSLASFESKLKVLQKEARLISPSTDRWKELTKEILVLERGIERINKKQRLGPTAGQRVGAAGGAFLYGGGMGGGVGSALGGIAGGLIGGVPGAFTGAAIGQVADNLGTALAGITSQASGVQKMQRGLAMASVDARDFAEAQAAVGEMSQKLLIPLEQTTKYFAQLRANTKEYNLSVADTRQILEGTALAIMATGGSAEDLDGAMRAVVQIMSKGGVQAEELRGQLGERFPGAVVKFAQANKMSFEELQQGLENGEIGIRQFIEFAKKNYTDYAKFSEQLATAPEYAGQRMKIAFEQISIEIGSLFGPMGAEIQDGFTRALQGITKFVKDNRAVLRQMIQDFGAIIVPILKVFTELLKIIGSFAFEVAKLFTSLFQQIKSAMGMANIASAKARLDKAKAATAGKSRSTPARQESVVDVVLGRATLKGVKDLVGINSDFEELDAAQKAFNDLGGMAAFKQANAPALPSNLTYGGAGAGMSIDRQLEEEKKKKGDGLESFERLRDQLANAYNQAEIERIKARHELEKRLQEDLYDMQEFGANRLQRQNLQFLRALAKAEQERQTTVLEAQLSIAAKAGKVAPSAPVLPPAAGGRGATSVTSFTSQQLARATQDASRFTGVANMCAESVKAFYKSLGISLPGVTAWADTVRKAGQTMTDWSQLRAGDIVATGRPGDTPHVGVYTGGQDVFHQSRSRGLKAGNYPDLSYFQKQGYFVRPNVGAGAPGKVGSNESRDTMAAAQTDIAQQNAAIAERGALLTKESTVLKELGRYMQEVYNVPDLTLDNQLLKARNDLMEQGVDPSVIDHKMRLLELDIQYQHLLKAFPSFADKANLSEEDRIKILGILENALKNTTTAEKTKNDETLRGVYVQERKAIADQLAMARALTPGQELRASIAQKGLSPEQSETLFQDTKALQGAQKLKEQMQGIASTIGDSFGNAFKGIISGSMTAREALAGMFQSIADSFADMVAKMIAEWIKMMVLKGIEAIINPMAGLGNLGGGGDVLGSNSSAVFGINSADMNQYAPLGFANGGIAPGGFTAFANGGMVTGPTMGLVGEGRYNEAIVPLPNGKSIPVELGGASQGNVNVVVNVDAKGSQVEGNEAQSKQLGRVVSAAVQAEIVKQQRPGGLLSSSRSF